MNPSRSNFAPQPKPFASGAEPLFQLHEDFRPITERNAAARYLNHRCFSEPREPRGTVLLWAFPSRFFSQQEFASGRTTTFLLYFPKPVLRWGMNEMDTVLIIRRWKPFD